nr:similar to phosphohistidine phosphatase, SixA [uncultured bacterium]
MGRWLARQGVRPDHIVASPAQRARQTVQLVCQELGCPLEGIHWDPRIYAAEVADLLRVLADIPAQAGRVLLVGHNPGLELLVGHLLVGHRAAEVVIKTATVVFLHLTAEWNAVAGGGCARLGTLLNPRDIDD